MTVAPKSVLSVGSSDAFLSGSRSLQGPSSGIGGDPEHHYLLLPSWGWLLITTLIAGSTGATAAVLLAVPSSGPSEVPLDAGSEDEGGSELAPLMLFWHCNQQNGQVPRNCVSRGSESGSEAGGQGSEDVGEHDGLP